MSRIRAPLSIEQLKEIQGRNDSADVLALLWEIRRLRSIAATADELDKSLGSCVGMLGLICAELRLKLHGEASLVMMSPPEWMLDYQIGHAWVVPTIRFLIAEPRDFSDMKFFGGKLAFIGLSY